jgi:hypothetical protein
MRVVAVVIAFHHSDARIGAGLAVSLVYQGLVTLTHENGWARAKWSILQGAVGWSRGKKPSAPAPPPSTPRRVPSWYCVAREHSRKRHAPRNAIDLEPDVTARSGSMLSERVAAKSAARLRTQRPGIWREFFLAVNAGFYRAAQTGGRQLGGPSQTGGTGITSGFSTQPKGAYILRIGVSGERLR